MGNTIPLNPLFLELDNKINMIISRVKIDLASGLFSRVGEWSIIFCFAWSLFVCAKT